MTRRYDPDTLHPRQIATFVAAHAAAALCLLGIAFTVSELTAPTATDEPPLTHWAPAVIPADAYARGQPQGLLDPPPRGPHAAHRHLNPRPAPDVLGAGESEPHAAARDPRRS